MAGVDATIVQKNLDIPKGQREPHIVHHRRADDLRAGFEIAKWGAFCHPVRLRNHPARLKLVLSDNALQASSLNAALCEISTPFTCKRRGAETRIVAGDRCPDTDQTLIRGLRNAREWAEALKSGEQLKHLAQRVGHSERYIRRVTSLISLSPGLQTAILEGTQPAHLNLETLVRGNIPLNWAHQDRLFGTHS